MTDITTLQNAARISTDENGEPVIQIPLSLWDEFKATFEEPEPQQTSQAERIRAVINSWEDEPDDTSPEWWDEFHNFLRENRFKLRVYDPLTGKVEDNLE